jgi:hypothetical protein
MQAPAHRPASFEARAAREHLRMRCRGGDGSNRTRALRSEKNITMPHVKKLKVPRHYPGRLTRDEYYALPAARRWLHAMRAKSDLLELWRSCSKKPCRRAGVCRGDERWLPAAEAGRLEKSESGAAGFRVQLQIPARAGRAVRGPREPAVQPLAQAAAVAATKMTRTDGMKRRLISMSSSAQADDPVITDRKVFTGCSAFAEHDKSRLGRRGWLICVIGRRKAAAGAWA